MTSQPDYSISHEEKEPDNEIWSVDRIWQEKMFFFFKSHTEN